MKTKGTQSSFWRHVQVACAGLVVAATLARGQGQTQGQSFAPIAPKQPEKPAPGKVVNEEATPMAAHGDNEVLVDALKGIVLVSDPKQVKAEGVTSRVAVEAGNLTRAQGPEFVATVQPYLGQPVTMKSLAELTRAIVTYFRDHDRPVVNVFVPEQTITTGYVQIVVVISKVEKVDATGAKWFSNDELRSDVGLQAGRRNQRQPVEQRSQLDQPQSVSAVQHSDGAGRCAGHDRPAAAHAGPFSAARLRRVRGQRQPVHRRRPRSWPGSTTATSSASASSSPINSPPAPTSTNSRRNRAPTSSRCRGGTSSPFSAATPIPTPISGRG